MGAELTDGRTGGETDRRAVGEQGGETGVGALGRRMDGQTAVRQADGWRWELSYGRTDGQCGGLPDQLTAGSGRS